MKSAILTGFYKTKNGVMGATITIILFFERFRGIILKG